MLLYLFIALTCILLVIVIALTVLLVIVARKAMELNDRLDALAEGIEESLDIIDGHYRKVSRVSETPVLSDDPIVRQFVESVKQVRSAIQVIANRIVEFERDKEGTDVQAR